MIYILGGTIMNSLKNKISGGRPVIGPFVNMISTEVVEILGLSGFDFCIIDGEHGPNTYTTLHNACLAGDAKDIDISIIFRVPENSNAAIGHALDLGAAGVLVPHVDDAESARAAVKAAKFHPVGERGMNGLVRAARFGSENLNEYMDKSNKETMLIIQIEGLEGMNNLDEILKVEGIDGIFIGPYDLSQSLGVPGQVDGELVQSKTKEIVDRIRNSNKDLLIGIFLTDMASAKKWVNNGIQFIAYQMDIMMLFNDAKKTVKNWRESISGK
jgi:4-hydroxy-2-oxoheptanedioate aldolase